MPGTLQAEPVVAVGAVVLDPHGRVLVVRRARPPGVGSWTLPGGHLEPEETMEAAVTREVYEETGVTAQIVCALGVVSMAREGMAFTIHEYLLLAHRGVSDPVPGDDAADARWASRAELGAHGVLPEAMAVIDRAFDEAEARGHLPLDVGTRMPLA